MNNQTADVELVARLEDILKRIDEDNFNLEKDKAAIAASGKIISKLSLQTNVCKAYGLKPTSLMKKYVPTIKQ